MSYSYEDATWSSDPIDMPQGPPYESLTFEDFETYFETQPHQTADPYPSPRRPQQQRPIASTSSSIPTWDFNESSSSIYPVSRGSSFPELPWTSDTSYSELHPIPSGNVISDTFNNFNLSVDYDDAFLANIDPSLINFNLFTATPNPSIAHAPNPVGHLSPSSRKRPYANEEPDFNHTSYNPSPKRRRLSTDGRIDLSTVVPPPHFHNNNSNAIPDIVNNGYVPNSPLSKSQTNVIPPQPHPCLSHHVSHPFVDISPAPPTTIPSAYVPVTQPGFSVSSQAIDYSTGSNVYSNANLNTASGGHNAFPWDPLSYSLPQAENGTAEWMIDLLGSENLLNATNAFGATPGPSVPTLVPPSLGQQAPIGAPYNDAIHTNAYANNATHSGADIRQHSNTKPQMSKTGHTANASTPMTGTPLTRGASSAELVTTLKSNQPTLPLPPSPTPAPPRPTKTRGKRRGQQPSPATHLWTIKDGKHKCLYKGPAMPGGCDKSPSTLKNLGRHMRTHACAEDKMSIPEADKVALNGLPEELRVEVATCFLRDADLHHCAYFREHGKRWSEVTLERPDNASRKHDVYNHPREYRKCSEKRQEKSSKEKKKTKSLKKRKAKP